MLVFPSKAARRAPLPAARVNNNQEWPAQ
jgi:hypothetical protein